MTNKQWRKLTSSSRLKRSVLSAVALGSLVACSSGERSQETLGENTSAVATTVTPNAGLRRVLVLSIDGMHAVDLYKWVTNNPRSNIARLYQKGIDYPNATTTTPSGGLPGILALATGGTPRTTGVYHEDSYDRTLYPPGSTCTGTTGTEVVYDASMVQDPQALTSPIEPAYLPRTLTAQGACIPVYPHDFLRAPTAFEVVQGTGRRTSWADSHASYEILSGQSGAGLSEFYGLEVTSKVVNGGTVNGVNLTATASLCDSTNSIGGGAPTYATCYPAAQAFDDVMVQSVINKIDGFSANGLRQAAVPTLLGMSFTAVEVAQKLPMGGYVDAIATPSSLLLQAFQHVDFSIGRILTELNTKHYIESTLVILTAKHGQAPMDQNLLRTEVSGGSPVVNPLPFVQLADPNVDALVASFTNPNSSRSPAIGGHVQTNGSGGLVWLQDQSNVNVSNVVQVLSDPLNGDAMGASVRPQGSIFSSNIGSGSELSETFGDPQSSDPLAAARAPNAFIQPDLGVVYTTDPDRIADHGGGSSDDINVPLVVSNSGIVRHVTIYDPVFTTQVATTILKALTLDGTKLKAANLEQTESLPGIKWGQGRYQAGSVITAVDFDSETNVQVVGTLPLFIGNFDAGSSVCFDDVYMNGVTAIRATVASLNGNGTFSVRLDSPNGQQIGSYPVQSTGGWTDWQSISTGITPTTGLHTLCFRGESSTGIANLLNFYLVGTCVPECTGATCGSDGCGGSCGTCNFNFVCDNPFAQCVTPPVKYSVNNPSLTPLIPAPAQDYQVGTTLGAGNTSVVGFDASDSTCYYGVDFTDVKSIVATYASATSGGTFSFRLDGPTGMQIGSYTVQSTGGATTWATKRIALTSTIVGTHALCVRGEGGSNIASFQSFEISATPVVPRGTVGATVGTVPPDFQSGTTNDSSGFVANFDANDYVCYENVDLTGVNSLKVAMATSTGGGGVVSVRVGGQNGTQIGTFTTPNNTGGWTTFANFSVGITPQTGLKTLCFFGVSGLGIGNFQSFTLLAAAAADFSVGKTIPAAPPDSSLGITSSGGVIGNFDMNDWFCHDSVDLTDVKAIVASAASGSGTGTFEVRLGSSTGTSLATFTATNTGSYSNFGSYRVAIPNTPSTQTLCIFGASGSGIANFQNLYLSPVP